VSVHGGHSSVGHRMWHVSRYIERLEERNGMRSGRHVEDWKRVGSVQGRGVDRQLAGVNKHLIDGLEARRCSWTQSRGTMNKKSFDKEGKI
jgi:hypothetical protein